MKLDSIDYRLIELLQEDCKQTTRELAEVLELSTTAVYERVKKLEKNNVISKYVAIIDRNLVDRGFVVLSMIKIKTHSKNAIVKFEKKITDLDEVLECYNISGDYDYILKIGVKDMVAYREFMLSKLTSMDEVLSSHSLFTIGEIKNSTEYKLL